MNPGPRRSEAVAGGSAHGVPDRFRGRVILVTGGGSGVGRAAALRFASESGDVIVADASEAAAASVTLEIRLGGGAAHAAVFDQGHEASVIDMFCRDELARGVDIVCVNAAVALPDRPLVEVTCADWERVHSVNLLGAFLVARTAIPALELRGGGAIVFTASVSALRAHPYAAPYAASKAGLLGLSRSLAVELGEKQVRVNCVCPGAVRTPMVDSVYGPDAGRMLDLTAAATPLGRVADPEDVAAAICFLASDDARHITATELIVDGGASATQS